MKKKLSRQAKEFFKYKDDKKVKVTKTKKNKMPIEYVITYNGEKEDITKCVELESKSGYGYGSKYALKTDHQLIKDVVTGEWFLSFHNSKWRVITDFKIRQDGQIVEIEEAWTLSKETPEFIFPNSPTVYYAISVKFLEEKGFIEHKVLGMYYHPTYNIHKSLNIEKPRYRKFSNPTKNKNLTLEEKIRYGIVSPTYNIFEGKRYTFGVELETSEGNIPYILRQNYNMSCVYDGSLKDEDGIDWGGEIVTGILSGDKGIEHLDRICQILSERCKVDKKCGVHVHIGNIKIDKAFIIAMYFLALRLEEEIFSMLPPSRKTNEYCKFLKPTHKLGCPIKPYSKDFSVEEYNIWIDETYETIFYWISSGTLPYKDCNKLTDHPRGHNAGYDKTTARYCWLNFVPSIFNAKKTPIEGDIINQKHYKLLFDSKTLEFRNHGATLNPMKVINWVKICIGLVAFAENYKLEIFKGFIGEREELSTPITLSSVMEKVYPKSFKRINKYIEGRKEYFASTKVANENKEYKEVYTDKKSLKEIVNEV